MEEWNTMWLNMLDTTPSIEPQKFLRICNFTK